MLALISPAKKLDAENDPPVTEYTTPQHLSHSQELVEGLRDLGRDRIKAMMKLSDSLADLNADRYKRYATPFTPNNAKQAIFMFRGDTYVGLDADTLDEDDLAYSQDHLRILSGLYGLLRPLDLMQPYRLEMGSKMPTERGEDLYDFWGTTLTDAINKATSGHENRAVVNLASNEYIKSIQPEGLVGPFVTCHFKEVKDGEPKTIGLYAKRARGMMARYMVKNRVEEVKGLRRFNEAGYAFREDLSTDADLVFVRDRE